MRAPQQLLFFLLALLALPGCTTYYEAEVSGYIRDDVSKEGINKAIVRIYFDNDDPASYQETFTQSYNGDEGFFVFRRVVWKTETPLFGDEGDLHDIRITVENEDYQPLEANVRIVSDAANSVGDVYMQRAFYVSGQVEGRLRDWEQDSEGEQPGINGRQLELYIPDVAITTEDEARAWVDSHNPDDYATTQANDGEDGYFVFNDVQWLDPDSYPEGEDERGTPWWVILRVDDPDYFELFEYGVEIVSGEVGCTIPDSFIDKRDYTGALEGWVVDPTDGEGINGARVEIFVPDEPITNEAEVQAWIDDNDPDATGQTRNNADEEEDGYFLIEGIPFELLTPPDHQSLHQSQGVILRIQANDYMDYVLYDDLDVGGFQPKVVVTSNDTALLMPDISLILTHFTSNLEGYVRGTPGASDTGENGVRLQLYYDPDDPDLSELTDFDPETTSWTDQVTTGNNEVGDEVFAGYFNFNALAWDNDLGGSLGNGKDQLTLILYSTGVDFSSFPGNTNPFWQKFVIASTTDDDLYVLPDLTYRAEQTGFTASAEGYVRTLPNDTETGINGVRLSLYHDPDDPDLSELVDFDPETARFTASTSTRNQTLGDQVYAGFFNLTGIEWENPQGGALENGQDELTVIVYSPNVDFSDFPDNTDPTWQRFILVSGTEGNVLPDLLYVQ